MAFNRAPHQSRCKGERSGVGLIADKSGECCLGKRLWNMPLDPSHDWLVHFGSRQMTSDG